MSQIIPVQNPSLVTYTHVIYALHLISVLIGVTGAATIVGSFIFGVPSIVAVVMNYARRREVAGTWLASHFGWQIRTFWWALLWFAIGGLLIVTLIGAVIGVPLLIIVGIWVIYRIARGWLALLSKKPLPM